MLAIQLGYDRVQTFSEGIRSILDAVARSHQQWAYLSQRLLVRIYTSLTRYVFTVPVTEDLIEFPLGRAQNTGILVAPSQDAFVRYAAGTC